MSLNTREELEQLLEDIQSRLSVIETAQTTKQDDEKPKDDEHSSDETSSEDESAEVESEDEIEKLLNS